MNEPSSCASKAPGILAAPCSLEAGHLGRHVNPGGTSWDARPGRWQRINRGHYRHVPSGYIVIQYVRRQGAWRVLDGGGHQVFAGVSFRSAKAWVDSHG